jgi:Tol biopolymer transport system component
VNDVHWSPDGREIAALLWDYSCADPCSRVAVLSADGRRLRRRSPAGELADGLAWSPDGRGLLYSLSQELRMVASDSGRTLRIWRASTGKDLEWMPGARSVLFGYRGIVKLTLRSGKTVRLTRFAGDPKPVASPDGRLVAFIRQRDCAFVEGCRDPANVYVVGADGKGLRRLTRNTNASSLHWSLDGRSLLFAERTAGIMLLSLDQEGVRTLTSDAGSWPIDWSPDGTKILFGRPGSLWVMDADGGRPTRLPFHRPGWSVMTPDWG